MSSITAILLLAAIAWFWLDSARAREIATGICLEMCQRHNLQLLDQTVSLQRIGLRWTSQGIRIRRRFHFDYSEEGTARLSGQITLTGVLLDGFTLDSVTTSAGKAGSESNVVSIRSKPPES